MSLEHLAAAFSIKTKKKQKPKQNKKNQQKQQKNRTTNPKPFTVWNLK